MSAVLRLSSSLSCARLDLKIKIPIQTSTAIFVVFTKWRMKTTRMNSLRMVRTHLARSDLEL